MSIGILVATLIVLFIMGLIFYGESWDFSFLLSLIIFVVILAWVGYSYSFKTIYHYKYTLKSTLANDVAVLTVPDEDGKITLVNLNKEFGRNIPEKTKVYVYVMQRYYGGILYPPAVIYEIEKIEK